MIGENKKFLCFNLPATTYQKVSDKTPQNTLGETIFFFKVIKLDGIIFIFFKQNSDFQTIFDIQLWCLELCARPVRASEA